MKRLALFVLIALISVISFGTLVHAQVYGPVFRVEYNTDRAGADINGGASADLGQCINSCASTSGCRAFTWVDINQQPPNYDNTSSLCWLKNSLPGMRRNPGMISGVREQ